MRAAIMQPTYLPWTGYFALIDQVDAFVFLDDVEFNDRSWQQRNRIKTDDGPMWLTVPVLTSGRRGQEIREVEINTDERWRDKHRKSIKFNYSPADHYDDYEDWLAETYGTEWAMLRELNVRTIESLADELGVDAEFVLSSELDAGGRKAHRLLEICRELGADEYLSALGSAEYIEDDNPFTQSEVGLLYQHYEHPTYSQLHGEFVSQMSVVDLLLNEGPGSRSVIREGERDPYTSEEVRREELG